MRPGGGREKEVPNDKQSIQKEHQEQEKRKVHRRIIQKPTVG